MTKAQMQARIAELEEQLRHYDGVPLKSAYSAPAEVERLRTVLRSLISCGGTSPTIKALAMNTLEPGSGDRWLASLTTSKEGTQTP